MLWITDTEVDGMTLVPVVAALAVGHRVLVALVAEALAVAEQEVVGND